MDLEKIEQRIDRTALGATEVSDTTGGVSYKTLHEALEFGKLMAVTEIGVPRHLRGSVGGCVRIVMQAIEWRMSPWAVADKSYFVNDKIAYESQLIHAVVESRANLQRRLRCEYVGEGPARVCVVSGLFKGEIDPCVYTSPAIGSINPKNSPLWKNDPDQQLWYFSVRAWARRYCPDVLLGIYTRDELEDAGEFVGADKAKDVTPRPKIADRLKGNRGEGFNAANVKAEADQLAAPAEQAMPVIEGEKEQVAA